MEYDDVATRLQSLSPYTYEVPITADVPVSDVRIYTLPKNLSMMTSGYANGVDTPSTATEQRDSSLRVSLISNYP